MPDYESSGSGETGKKEIGASGTFGTTEWENLVSKTDLEVDSQGRLRLAGRIIKKDLLHYYNPDEIKASTGSGISTFPDTGSSPEDLTGGTPTYEANAMGSADAPVYDATDDKLEAPNISNWQFLHDGTQSWEMFVVVQPSGSGSNDMTGSLGNILGTQNLSLKDRQGFVLAYEDRSGQNDVLEFGIAKSDGWVIRGSTSDGMLPKDTVSIINFRYDKNTDTYTGEVNEMEFLSTSATDQDTGYPTTTYTHGNPEGSFISPFGGAIGDNPIYDRVLTSSERSNNYSVLADKYGVTL